MKRSLQFLAIFVVLALAALPLMGHHAADGIVDEEIYEMIDAMVADTPHASWDGPVDMGGGVTEMTIQTSTVVGVENMVDDGLLNYASMLDGEVSVLINFDGDNSRRVALTISQFE